MKKIQAHQIRRYGPGADCAFPSVTGLYFVVCNGAFCPLCQDYFISNGETYIWDTRGGYLEPLSVYRHCHYRRRLQCWTSGTGMHKRVLLHRPDGIVRFAG